MHAYSFSDVLKYTGATRSNLIHWTAKNAIRAEIAEADGPGHYRRFSFFNLLQAAIATRLNWGRLPVADIAGCLNGLAEIEYAALKRRFTGGLKGFTCGSAEADREMVDDWRAIRNPAARRAPFPYVVMIIPFKPGASVSLVTRYWNQPDFGDIFKLLGDGGTIIHVGWLLVELERATGDHLPNLDRA